MESFLHLVFCILQRNNGKASRKSHLASSFLEGFALFFGHQGSKFIFVFQEKVTNLTKITRPLFWCCFSPHFESIKSFINGNLGILSTTISNSFNQFIIEWICYFKCVPRNTIFPFPINECLSLIEHDALCQLQSAALLTLPM